MKEKFITILSFCILLSCTKKNEIYESSGIPDGNHSFSHIYFKSRDEGYLFGTLMTLDDLSDENLDDPNFQQNSSDQAIIYKTSDGGKTWARIKSLQNHKFHNIADEQNHHVFLTVQNSLKDHEYRILKYNVDDQSFILSNTIKSISDLWTSKSLIYFTTNKNNIKAIILDNDLKPFDSINIDHYVLNGVGFPDNSFCIFSNYDKSSFGSLSKKHVIYDIGLPIVPNTILHRNNQEIIIIGNNKSKKSTISIVNFNSITEQYNIMFEFIDYEIVHSFHSNARVMAGFVGNFSGSFIEYDLVYSLDKGQTWQLKKLEEANTIGPSCLVENILYIYSGRKRIQRIILN